MVQSSQVGSLRVDVHVRDHTGISRRSPFREMSGKLVILAEDLGDSLEGEVLDGLELALPAQVNGRSGRLHVSVRRFEEHATADRGARKTRRLDSRQLDVVCEAMRGHMQSGVSLSKIAALIGMSGSQLSRSFHATTGMTFTAFVMRLRITEAMHLMTETDLPLCDIAIASGFGDQSHFSRSFVRSVGLTPFKWRLANRPNVTIPSGFGAARKYA
jgi:AraC-like DNA-binding protein